MINTARKFHEELATEIIGHLGENEAELKNALTNILTNDKIHIISLEEYERLPGTLDLAPAVLQKLEENKKNPDLIFITTELSRIGEANIKSNPTLSILSDLYTSFFLQGRALERWDSIDGFYRNFPDFVNLAESHMHDKPHLASSILSSTAYHMTHAEIKIMQQCIEATRKASEIFVQIIKDNLETAPETALWALEQSEHNWMARKGGSLDLNPTTVYERCLLANKMATANIDNNPKMAVRALNSIRHGQMHKPHGHVYHLSPEKWRELSEKNFNIMLHIAEKSDDPQLSLKALTISTYPYKTFEDTELGDEYRTRAHNVIIKIKTDHAEIKIPKLVDEFFSKAPEKKAEVKPATSITNQKTTWLGNILRFINCPNIAKEFDASWHGR